ncbi:hypothetical protein Emag_005505 [Eimeria magna]
MAKSSYKQRFGGLALAVVLLLHSQHDRHFFAVAGETDGDWVGQHPAGVNGQKAVARGQGIESSLDETATDTEFSTIQSVTGEDKTSAVLNEDGAGAEGELAVESSQAHRFRRAKAACRIVAAVLVLSILGRSLVSSGRAALRKELSHLQKLEALVPVAEKLSTVLGTPESGRLWGELKAMLPEVRQTLSEAEAQLAEKSRFRIDLSKKPYREIIGRVKDVVSRTSESIAALHRNARDELLVSQNIRGIELSGIGPYQKKIEKIMGADYAKAYVTLVESQEAHVGKILQAANQVIMQSSDRPLFVDYRDGPSLLATLHDFEKLRHLARARDTVQTIMDKLAYAGNEPLRVVVGTDIRSTLHEFSALHDMLNGFLEKGSYGAQQVRRIAMQGKRILEFDIGPLSRQYRGCEDFRELLDLHSKFWDFAENASKFLALPEDSLIPQLEGEDKRRLYEKVHPLITEVAKHAEGVRFAASSRRPTSDHKGEGLWENPVRLCQRMKQTFFQMTEKVVLDAQDAANACEQIFYEISDQDSAQDLYRKFMLAFREDSKAAKGLKNLDAICGQGNLLGVLEADIMKSLEVVDAVNVADVNPKSAAAKLITSQKMAVAKDVAALGEAGSLSAIAEAAARIREAAVSIQLAACDGTLLQF